MDSPYPYSPPKMETAITLLDLLLPSATTALSPLLFLFVVLLFLYLSPGGPSWVLSSFPFHLKGPHGSFPMLAGSRPHQLLSNLAHRLRSTRLMAFSIGFTRFIISSHPDTAKEILQGTDFADRPLKISARELLFDRAMGFAPYGDHWRSLRRIASTHLFSPKRIQCWSEHRRQIGLSMVEKIKQSMERSGEVRVREVLQLGSLDSMMGCIFGRSCKSEGVELERMVREGYDLLGGFNWGDHLPILAWMDFGGVKKRCNKLAGEVTSYVGGIIDEHRERRSTSGVNHGDGNGDLVDVLLGMEEEMGLSQTDMIAVLWELIFRGTDTVAILLEWALARLILHPDVQRKARDEVLVSGSSEVHKLPCLHSIVKETLRLHPPGPLLSWARLATRDTVVDGHLVPAGTTAMVNMWAIMRDDRNWDDAGKFRPERFVENEDRVTVMGGDLRIAPFGAGRRVCPGKALAMENAQMWLAQLLQAFHWEEAAGGVDLEEHLNMSMEKETPLVCRALATVSLGGT